MTNHLTGGPPVSSPASASLQTKRRFFFIPYSAKVQYSSIPSTDHTHTHTHARARAHTQTNTHAHTRTYTHTHTHTHTHNSVSRRGISPHVCSQSTRSPIHEHNCCLPRALSSQSTVQSTSAAPREPSIVAVVARHKHSGRDRVVVGAEQ